VLLGLNVAVYVAWQLAARQSGEAALDFMAANFRVSLGAVLSGRVWTLLTSACSHVEPGHLFVNMLALYVFGRDVLLRVGRVGFVHLYVAGGIVASLGHVLWQVATDSPVAALGASGSVMAIAVVYAALFPRRILMVNFFIPVPAALAVAAYIAIDVVGAVGGLGGSVAHAAHLGGAAYGLSYWLVRLRGRGEAPAPQ